MICLGDGFLPPFTVVFGGSGRNLGIKKGNMGVGRILFTKGITLQD